MSCWQTAARMQFRQKLTRGKKKLIEEWARCIKENGPDVFLNEMSRLSGVHLTDVTHKSIDGSPSVIMHQNTYSAYVPLLLLISCWSAETGLQHLLTFPLKMNLRPEIELLIVVPMGRASPYNVCKQIYVPTVSGTPTTRHIFTSCRGEAAILRWSWPAVVIQFHWRVNLWTFFSAEKLQSWQLLPRGTPLQDPIIIWFFYSFVRIGNGFSSIIRWEWCARLAEC